MQKLALEKKLRDRTEPLRRKANGQTGQFIYDSEYKGARLCDQVVPQTI